MKKFLSGILLVGFLCVSTASFAEVSAEEYFDLGDIQTPIEEAYDFIKEEGLPAEKVLLILKEGTSPIILVRGEQDECLAVSKEEQTPCTQKQVSIVTTKEILDAIRPSVSNMKKAFEADPLRGSMAVVGLTVLVGGMVMTAFPVTAPVAGAVMAVGAGASFATSLGVK